MTHTRLVRVLLCALVALLLAVSTASAAQGPPPPKNARGSAVEVLGQGIPTPTAFAFVGSTVFVAAAGSEDGKQAGGIFTLQDGKATLVPGSPRSVFGLVAKGNVLYATSGTKLLALRGWDGTRFAKTTVLYKGPRGFSGFNGVSLGPDGRLYAGVTLTEDAKASKKPYAQSLLSFRTDGRGLKVVAKGLRQPWMSTFVKGIAQPFLTVLGQENLGKKQPPDYILRVRAGDNYGFPTCNWSKPAACKRYAKPISLLPAHSSPMGITSIGRTLYVALFNGTGKGPMVASLPASGGSKLKPVLTGFAAPVVGLAAHGGWIYAGDLTGAVYRTKP